MSNQLIHLLDIWQRHKDQTEWVLGTVFKTQGPCYRKAGAMMLLGGDGRQLGMLSGGCLESDIRKHARRVMLSGQPMTLTYDGSDEDDLSFQLGIGCGGTIELLLQPVGSENAYQQLDRLWDSLKRRESGHYYVSLEQKSPPLYLNHFEASATPAARADILPIGGKAYLQVPILPAPHILICGGGLDARPLVSMCSLLGWTTTLWDPRPANARQEYFMSADTIIRLPSEQLRQYSLDNGVEAAVLMSHQLTLDAEALKALVLLPPDKLGYLALLGPEKRRGDVLKIAALSEQDLPECGLCSPAGLNLGGELPESIALAIISQCHAALYAGDGLSLGTIENTPETMA